MATTVTDLHERLRKAGMSEAQAFAMSAAFESLDRQIGDVRTDMQEIRRTQRVHSMLLGVILAAVLAPYVGMLFGIR